jgi:hypothetical protein
MIGSTYAITLNFGTISDKFAAGEHPLATGCGGQERASGITHDRAPRPKEAARNERRRIGSIAQTNLPVQHVSLLGAVRHMFGIKYSNKTLLPITCIIRWSIGSTASV